ncbi:hypothetical protein HF888_10920 [Bermanella marisrubri]|uniref:Uncharacterized protein n=2 Tax=Bermanella marisrubri TaxID=207949 RepID=Q1N5J7_9GAMM|nr:hypothetical protein RED65_11144 [Oceanobacter sp. RED65] [Bermanella marisrubri]QIZ84696.1 hypothetical protein HF888_10920 [Bermanella marisrubri]
MAKSRDYNSIPGIYRINLEGTKVEQVFSEDEISKLFKGVKSIDIEGPMYLSPDRKYLALMYRESYLYNFLLINMENRQVEHSVNKIDEHSKVFWSPDSQTVYFYDRDFNLFKYDLKSKSQEPIMSDYSYKPSRRSEARIEIYPSENLVLVPLGDMHFYDLSTGEYLRTEPRENYPGYQTHIPGIRVVEKSKKYHENAVFLKQGSPLMDENIIGEIHPHLDTKYLSTIGPALTIGSDRYFIIDHDDIDYAQQWRYHGSDYKKPYTDNISIVNISDSTLREVYCDNKNEEYEPFCIAISGWLSKSALASMNNDVDKE